MGNPTTERSWTRYRGWCAAVFSLFFLTRCDGSPDEASDAQPKNRAKQQNPGADTASEEAEGDSAQGAPSDSDAAAGSDTDQESDASDGAAEGSDDGPSQRPCESTPWGGSCKVDHQIYNLTFFGMDLSDNSEREISFTDIRCAGFGAAVMIAGDTWCGACPQWYEEIGKHADEIHRQNGAIVVSSTDQFGAANLTNAEAATATASAHPDYTTGIDPYVFPCRYTFTPFTMVIDLETGTILGKDTEQAALSVQEILDLLASAND